MCGEDVVFEPGECRENVVSADEKHLQEGTLLVAMKETHGLNKRFMRQRAFRYHADLVSYLCYLTESFQNQQRFFLIDNARNYLPSLEPDLA